MDTQLFVDSAAPVPTIRVVGDVDLALKKAFAHALVQLDERVPSVAIDVTRCEFFDSSALGALANFARPRGAQRLVLVAPGPHAKRLLHLVGFDQIFTIVDDLADLDGLRLHQTA